MTLRKMQRPNHAFRRSASVFPIRAGEGDTLIPADSIAAIFDSASPLPPEMMAPAWPMRRPGGAVRPAMNPTIGFLRPRSAQQNRRRAPPPAAADLADHHDRLGRLVGEEHLEDFDELGALDGIAADAGRGRLPQALTARLVDRLLGG